MHSLGEKYAKLELDSLLLDEQERCACFQLHPADTIAADDLDPCARYNIPKPCDWVKADFDQDGQPDLLINAGYGDVYCVLNRGGQPPQVVEVADGRHTIRGCYAFEVIQVAGRPVIAHLQIDGIKPNRRAEYETVARQDTLVYHMDSFVEYNPHPVPVRRGQLVFCHNDGGPPPRTVFHLTVNLKTGRVRCNTPYIKSEEEVLTAGKFRFQLRAGTLDTLRQQVAYLPVAHLAPAYAINADDADGYKLLLALPHQHSKQVKDYGGYGLYGLRRLYNLLYDTYEQAIAQRRQQLQQRPVAHP